MARGRKKQAVGSRSSCPHPSTATWTCACSHSGLYTCCSRGKKLNSMSHSAGITITKRSQCKSMGPCHKCPEFTGWNKAMGRQHNISSPVKCPLKSYPMLKTLQRALHVWMSPKGPFTLISFSSVYALPKAEEKCMTIESYGTLYTSQLRFSCIFKSFACCICDTCLVQLKNAPIFPYLSEWKMH